jgi:hypothetical protein
MPVVSRGMQHGGNRQCALRFVHFVDHAIRKSFRHSPANVFGWMALAAKQWIDGQRIPHPDDLFNEVRPKSRLAFFVPCSRFGHVPFDFWSDLNPPTHYVRRSSSGLSSPQAKVRRRDRGGERPIVLPRAPRPRRKGRGHRGPTPAERESVARRPKERATPRGLQESS